jgi:hypothetical protein
MQEEKRKMSEKSRPKKSLAEKDAKYPGIFIIRCKDSLQMHGFLLDFGL